MRRITRVGFLIGGNESYGVSRFITSIVMQLRRDGVECLIFAMSSGALAELCEEAGAKVTYSTLGIAPNFGRGLVGSIAGFLKVLWYSFRARSEVGRWVRGEHVETLIVRMPNLVFICGLAAAAAGTQSYWIMPNAVSSAYPFQINKVIYDLFFRFTSMRPVANSNYTRTTLLRRGVGAKVLHLGVDPSQFSETIPYPTAAPVLVFGIFARLVAEKGQSEFIKAFASADIAAQAQLMIVGGPLDSPYGQELRDLASRLGVGSRVLFKGAVADVRELYSVCHVVVNSRIDPEPFGLSVIEAMMMGRPVLAHQAGGPGETIIDGVTGWLASDPSVSTFRDTLLRAIADLGSWPQMGAAARSHALASFGVDTVAKNLRTIMEADSNG